MTQSTSERFACPACDKRFTWKDGLEGQSVRCKCGHVFVATRPVAPAPRQPTARPAPIAPPDEFDLYDDDEPAAAPPTRAVPSAAPALPHEVPAPVALGVYPGRRRRKAQQEDDDAGPSIWKDRYIPLALLAIGLLGWVLLVAIFPMANVSVGRGLVTGGVMVMANLVSLFLTLLTVAALLSLNFGSPGAAALKLGCIAVFASAVFFTCVRLDYPKDIRGAILGLHVVMIVYWTCFSMLFDLELQETMITVALIALVQAMIGCVVMKV